MSSDKMKMMEMVQLFSLCVCEQCSVSREEKHPGGCFKSR